MRKDEAAKSESRSWKERELSLELRRVAREKGTEAPFTGKYLDNHEKVMDTCASGGA